MSKIESYPLQLIEELLSDQYFLSKLSDYDRGFFQQHLNYEDYIGECLRTELYLRVERSFSALWEDIMNTYWDTSMNESKVQFYGHRMLVILEKVNLSYLTYPYYTMVCGMFSDFEVRVWHHLNLDMQFTLNFKNKLAIQIDA